MVVSAVLGCFYTRCIFVDEVLVPAGISARVFRQYVCESPSCARGIEVSGEDKESCMYMSDGRR